MSLIKGINVGTSDITASYTDVSNEKDTKTITVTAEDLIYIEKPSDSVYTSFEQKPKITVKAMVDGEEVVLTEDVDYILTYSNNINAGTASVTATGIGNFQGSLTEYWTIENADFDVSYYDQSYTYTGHNQNIGISVSANSNEILILYGIEEGVYDNLNVPVIVNVSDSTTIYFKVTAPNYNTYEGSYNININPVIAKLSWGELRWTYDGKTHFTTCEVSNLINNDTCDVILSGNYITNIGKSTVKVVELSNTNYTLPTDGSDEQMLIVGAGMFLKIKGVWTPVKSVYKKVNGSWIIQDINVVFDTTGRYIGKNG